MPIWYSETEEAPFITPLIDELNAADEPSSTASHPVSIINCIMLLLLLLLFIVISKGATISIKNV